MKEYDMDIEEFYLRPIIRLCLDIGDDLEDNSNEFITKKIQEIKELIVDTEAD